MADFDYAGALDHGNAFAVAVSDRRELAVEVLLTAVLVGLREVFHRLLAGENEIPRSVNLALTRLPLAADASHCCSGPVVRGSHGGLSEVATDVLHLHC